MSCLVEVCTLWVPFLIIFCLKLQRNKVALVVSQHRHGGGQHGKQELVSRLVTIVLQSGREWAAEVSGVLGCRRLDQRQSRCVSSPSSSPQPWTGPCVYPWPQRTSVLHSSQQLAAVLSQAASVWPSTHSQGQKKGAGIRPCLNHLICRKCVHTVKACLNPSTWVDPRILAIVWDKNSPVFWTSMCPCMFVDCCIEIVVSLDKQGMIPLWEPGRWSIGEICKLASQSPQEILCLCHDTWRDQGEYLIFVLLSFIRLWEK